MVEKYINKIQMTRKGFNPNIGYDDNLYPEFYGDGEWDFEDSSFDCKDETIINYIDYCHDQIKLAKDALKEKLYKELEFELRRFKPLTNQIIEVYGYQDTSLYRSFIRYIITREQPLDLDMRLLTSEIQSFLDMLETKHKKLIIAIL